MITPAHEVLGRSVERSFTNLTSTTARPSHHRKSTETELWSKVLRLAVLDALCASPVTQKDTREELRDDAAQWILSDLDGPASFRWTCQLLSLSPAAVREAITNEANRRRTDKRKRMSVRMKYWTRN